MTNEEYEFILMDRIAKIQAINAQYDLLHNSYVSFSGGKDSTVLHYLIDLALPNNNIPRVYANTGIEYNEMVKFVKFLSSTDDRIVILNQSRNIKKTLDEFGYPFKSKEHSLRVYMFNKGNFPSYLNLYINGIKKDGSIADSRFTCPSILKYQFKKIGIYNYSNKCCYKLKKDLLNNWMKCNNKFMNITGMRHAEGGNRKNLTCITNNGHSFHPLIVCSDEWMNEFINRNNIQLCKLYYSPFNFERSGCKGCPYNLHLQEDLLTMKKFFPSEYKQCLILWKPVYDEYVRLGYRLDKNFYNIVVSYNIFDFL